MPMRPGSTRARAAARREQGAVRTYRRTAVCSCGVKFKYPPGSAAPELCSRCTFALADRATIYDRDCGIGWLPQNLAHYAVALSDWGMLIRKPSPTARFATATHEAAHGVYAISHRLLVDELSIKQQGNAAGWCWFTHRDAPPEIVAEVFLAGFQGERLLIPETDFRVATTDFQEAASRLPLGADIDAVVLKVRRRVASLWPEILRLAEALDRQGELIGATHIRSIARLPSWL